MGNVLEALLFSGYNPNELSVMDKLIDEYKAIKNQVYYMKLESNLK